MDGVDNPPFLRRMATRLVNTVIDGSYVVPQRIWKVRLRLPRPKPRNDQVFFIGATNVPRQRLDPRSRAPGAWDARCSSASRTRSTASTCSTSTWRRSRTRPTRRSEAPGRARAHDGGYSPAKIEQVCSIALMAAHHDGRAAFDRDDILTAMATVEMGSVVDFEYTADELRAHGDPRGRARDDRACLPGRDARVGASRPSGCAPTARAATTRGARRTTAPCTSAPSSSSTCSSAWARSRPSTSSTARTPRAWAATCRASRASPRAWSATTAWRRSGCRCRRP